MTVTTTTNKVTATGNGSATSFSFNPIVIFSSSDLAVVTTVIATGVETIRTEGTGPASWSTSLTVFPATGSITYPADEVIPLPSTETITISLALTIDQQTDLNNQGGYFADVQETAFDKLTLIAQQQQEEIDRSFTFPISYTGVVAAEIPAPITGDGGKVVGLNDAETALAFLTPNSDTYLTTPVSVTDGDAVVFDGVTGQGFRSGGPYQAINGIINSAFDHWQRATSQSVSGYGSVDRWRMVFQTADSGVGTATRTSHSEGAAEISNSEFYVAFDQTTGGDAGFSPNMQNRIEDVWTYSDETITVSFRARLQSGSSDVTPRITQNFGSAGSSSVINTGTPITLTSTFEDYTQTFSVASISAKTVGANSYVELSLRFDDESIFRIDTTWAKVDRGSEATKFVRAGGSKGADLELCKRYYVELDEISVVSATAEGRFANNIVLPVTMRIAPTITVVLNGGTGGDFGQATVNSVRQVANNSIDEDCTIKLDAEL